MRKSKAGTGKCICGTCPRRFECFTQERVFSDALLQGLFEAILAEGVDREEAIKQVKDEIKFRLTREELERVKGDEWRPVPNIYPNTGTAGSPYYQPPTWRVWSKDSSSCDSYAAVSSNNIKFDYCNNDTVNINYTMHNGKEYSFSAKVSEL